MSQWAQAGAGNDQPFNIVVTTPYQSNINWAQVCWNTTRQSDSMLLFGHNGNFDRQVYDPTMTTNHCVVVRNLEPSTMYHYSAASCTDPVGGVPCVKTDANWSSAPWPTSTPTFTTVASTGGNLGFQPFAWGPNYVYQGTGINVGVSLIQTGGVVTDDDVLMLTNASIDGQSCLPGGLTGAPCGSTNISFTMVCANTRETVNPPTNNYTVYLWPNSPYANDYLCWNHFFDEPSVEVRLVPGSSQQTPTGRGKSINDSGHNLSMTLQVIDYKTSTPVSDPQTVTWQFSVKPTPQFTVTPPTTFPPIPNYNAAINVAGKFGASECEQLKTMNQAGEFLNGDLTVATSVNDPWDIYTYDGNRVFKEMGDRFDGVTGPAWQPHHAYNQGDYIVIDGYDQVATQAGNTGNFTAGFSNQPGQTTQDNGTLVWTNAGNKAYWNACSEIVGTQYLNWAVNVPNWSATAEWNIFPWGMYMDFLRQGDVLSENCIENETCQGLNETANTRSGANILTYPGPQYNNQDFTYTYTANQTESATRRLPYNTNIALVNWLETGVEPTNELQKRVDILIQTVSEAVNYNPLDDGTGYKCCYNAANWSVGLWASTLINTYDVEQYMNATPDPRIPVELRTLLDWFYSTQVNQMGDDHTFPYQPYAVPYNCSIFTYGKTTVNGKRFSNDNCWNADWDKNDLLAPAYAWLGAVYGDSCTLPTSGKKCWDAADELFSNAWQGFDYTDRGFNYLLEEMSNYVGWRTGAFPGTDSYVLPTHNPLQGPYPDVIGPYPAAQYPAAPAAFGISGSGATITWYTYEKAISTVVQLGTDPNNLNLTSNCGPSTYTGTDNLWTNTCIVSGLQPGTLYYFGVGGTDAAGNFAFSAIDPSVNLQGNYFNFTTQ